MHLTYDDVDHQANNVNDPPITRRWNSLYESRTKIRMRLEDTLRIALNARIRFNSHPKDGAEE